MTDLVHQHAHWRITNSKARPENASHGAPHEKHFEHADLHDSSGVGTFLHRIERKKVMIDKFAPVSDKKGEV